MLRKIKKNNINKLWKPFLILFLLSFIVINWSEIDWMFNYNFLLRGAEGIFGLDSAGAQEKELPTIEITKDLPKAALKKKEEQKINISDILTDSRIEIPRIKVSAPVIFPEGKSEKNYQKALKKGVLYYPDSVFPGEKGAIIILGHSAPPNWPKINYDWVFNDLSKLEQGDYIYLDTSQNKYEYKISEKFFVNKGEPLPDLLTKSEKSYIILISCWPPGKDIKRIVIVGELI